MTKNPKKKPTTIFGVEMVFADGTPVPLDHFGSDPSEEANDAAAEIDEDELDEEIRILDELREHPERSAELADKGGISYRVVKDD